MKQYQEARYNLVTCLPKSADFPSAIILLYARSASTSEANSNTVTSIVVLPEMRMYVCGN